MNGCLLPFIPEQPFVFIPFSCMENLRKTFYLLLCLLAATVMTGSLLSVFTDTENRFFKMLDFPRIQFFVTALVSMILFVIITKRWRWYDYLLIVGMLGGLIIQVNYLGNYTPLVHAPVPDAEGETETKDKISLLLANVKMSNRESQSLLDLVKEKKPDLLLAMETDAWWDKELTVIQKEYPYKKETINEATYGMILYSKMPLQNVAVNYMQHENVPSFECTLALPSGKSFGLYAVHPVPPTRFEDIPDNAGEEEIALLEIGKKVKDRRMPAIVAGDLNDVVWGNTDELTGTENLLHDVRVGRGFYNSYNAENFLMRWPLDHVFVTREFSLTRLERLRDIDSDHFPIFVELVL